MQSRIHMHCCASWMRDEAKMGAVLYPEVLIPRGLLRGGLLALPALTNAAPDRGDRVPRARSLRTMMGWRYWTRRLLFVSKEYPPGYRGRRIMADLNPTPYAFTPPDIGGGEYQPYLLRCRIVSPRISGDGIGNVARRRHRQAYPRVASSMLSASVGTSLTSSCGGWP